MYAINLNAVPIQPGLSDERNSNFNHQLASPIQPAGTTPYSVNFRTSDQNPSYPSSTPSSEGIPVVNSKSHIPLNFVRLDGPDTNIHPGFPYGIPDQRRDSFHNSFSDEVVPPFVVPSSQQPSASSSTAPRAGSARSKKTRREKPRVALSPDQPPTTQGKPRARVYVACLQCRTRKIRCDGAKPICHACGRRTGNPECTYDAVPKRRGPDKIPGARQRMGRDMDQQDNAPRRQRRRDTTDSEQSASRYSPPDDQTLPEHLIPPSSLSPESSDQFSSPIDYIQSPSLILPPLTPIATTSYAEDCACHGLHPCPSAYSSQKGVTHQSSLPFNVHYSDSQSYVVELDDEGNERSHEVVDMGSQPSVAFTRQMWWDSLISLYCSSPSTPLSSSMRQTIAENITSDIRFLFKTSNYWLSFFHVPSFFAMFHDPRKRSHIQPSLVLALLALATFFQSSEVGRAREGRQRALKFREEAQSALEASFNAGWIDETLAQAAFVLAFFEICAHPLHSTHRSVSAMVRLDSIIRGLSLTFVDVDDPEANTFPPCSVPAVVESSVTPARWSSSFTSYDTTSPWTSPQAVNERGCVCASLTLGRIWPAAHELTPMWHATPAWFSAHSEGEIRKESSRRLCWSAMTLAAGHTAYAAVATSSNVHLWISDPANYALLFSGESVTRSPSLGPRSAKDTIWALYDRSFLLWHSCVKMRHDSSASDVKKAEFALKAWFEADSIETALDRHTCDIERNFLFQGREYIFNTRMCITYEFRRYVPLVPAGMRSLFNRRKAEEWLTHQKIVTTKFRDGLHTITGNSNNILARRPFFVFWFMSQMSRALSLWHCDNTMTLALDVCKTLLGPIEYLSNLWPCPEQRDRFEYLRERLNSACYIAGLPTVPAPNYTSSP